jgi:molybdate transport system ATP-binding protein
MIQARLRHHFPGRADSAGFTLDVDFSTTAASTVLFGPSGAGKTLTLDCIAGFVRPREGRISIGARVLYDAATGICVPPRDRHCGYVFQKYALFPHRTLRENLEFAAERLPGLERHRRIKEMIERFQLSSVTGRRPHELSGGQKQRCSIARALLAAPKIVLLDEPAQGLDWPLRSELYAVLRQVKADFATPIILVTHDLDECFELGDWLVVVHEGRIVQNGPPREVLDEPAGVEVAQLLGRHNLLSVEVRKLDPSRDSSILRWNDVDLDGPYLPGHLIGDRVMLYVRPEQLRALPRDGKPGPNQAPAVLERAAERTDSYRLEFSGGIAVALARADYERYKGTREWVIEIPASVIRVF